MKTLKFIPALLVFLIAGFAFTACDDDDSEWDDYSEWRKANIAWLNEQAATGKYEKVVPLWNDSLYVYMRWLNDTTLTSGNLTPLFTSEIAVTYKGTLYDGTPFDSTYTQVDSTVTLLVNNVITGWPIAFERTHVGDHIEVLIPYQAGYGSQSLGAVLPYSTLVFDIILHDITAYEIKP